MPIKPRPLGASESEDLTLVRPPRSSPSARFRNQSDYIYFRFFSEKSTRTLAGPYRDNLWERVVLQACHNEPCIRALAASVGALELFRNSYGTPGGALPLGKPHPSDSHRFYAVDQYGKGLAGIRRIAESRQPGAARHAIIAAILIYCFESMYEGPETGVQHFEKALHYLSTELARHGRPYRHLATSSPAPDFEHELVEAFVRLDSGLMTRPSSCLSDRAHQFRVTCDFSDQSLPPSFSSIKEARSHLEQAHFSSMPELVRSWALAREQKGLQLPDEVLAVARQTSARAASWMAAFEPMFERAVASHARGGPFSAEYALQIQALMSNMIAQTTWSSAADAQEHRALERDLAADGDVVNALAKAIADEPGFQKTFVWDNIILQPLTILMGTARKHATRFDAVQILKSVRPRREGAYDSVAIVEIGEDMLRRDITHNPFLDF